VGLLDKLRRASVDLRELWISRGPDSYSVYKGKREHERKEDDHARERQEDSAARERETAERERGFDERYTLEREADASRERAKRAEKTDPEP
jgi:ATPase subunit of ABC transporter with duplicated ATPase domains